MCGGCLLLIIGFVLLLVAGAFPPTGLLAIFIMMLGWRAILISSNPQG